MRETYFVYLTYILCCVLVLFCVWTSFDLIFSMVDMYPCVVNMSFFVLFVLCYLCCGVINMCYLLYLL